MGLVQLKSSGPHLVPFTTTWYDFEKRNHAVYLLVWPHGALSFLIDILRAGYCIIQSGTLVPHWVSSIETFKVHICTHVNLRHVYPNLCANSNGLNEM